MVVRLTPRQPVLPLDGESAPLFDGVGGREVAKVAREVGGGKNTQRMNTGEKEVREYIKSQRDEGGCRLLY